jgi:hypothetical protein
MLQLWAVFCWRARVPVDGGRELTQCVNGPVARQPHLDGRVASVTPARCRVLPGSDWTRGRANSRGAAFGRDALHGGGCRPRLPQQGSLNPALPAASRFRCRGGTWSKCAPGSLWAPEHHPKTLLPVMVWIHGGGNSAGMSAQTHYDDSSFARDGVVLVSLNYRLGLFGFFAHPALPGTADFGLLDQLVALKSSTPLWPDAPDLAGLQQRMRRLDAVRTRRPAADCPGVGERPADTRLLTGPRVGGTRVISLDAFQLPRLMAYAVESVDDLRVGIELQLVLNLLRIDQTIAQ